MKIQNIRQKNIYTREINLFYVNLNKTCLFGVCMSHKNSSMIYLISMIYRKQTAITP